MTIDTSNTARQQQQQVAADTSHGQATTTGCRRQRHSGRRRPLIGAIDQGTSSTRFLVFENETGKLVASSQLEIKRIIPKEGWVEMDPIAIMDSVYATIENVHQQLMSRDESLIKWLKCIGICNQRESAVVWDSVTGEPLYNVIVWLDNRTKDLVDDMIDSAPGRDMNALKDKTGLPMSTYFSAFKLKWLIDNVEPVKQALAAGRLLFGTVDSWILWNLTGNHLTDVTNASRTFLMDIETLEWDKSLCKHFNVPHKILPKILASADDFGHIKRGPLMGLPITGVIGDQSAALFGHNCLQLGQTKATFGTGCFIMQNIGPGPLHGALKGTQREAKRGLITTVGYKLRGRPASYALEGSVKIAGAALTWLRDNMQLIGNYEECDQLVNMTSHAAGVFFVPALGGLYSPYWDPNATGLFIGLSQFSRREHLVRATFDSIAFQTNDILSLMRGVANGLMIDGGLCKSDNMCQILADITGCDIVRPSMCETSALGAAMVAGCGAALWSYEQMLANPNTPYEFCSGTNQNHHYPHESLHYEDKFSSLINSRHLAAVAAASALPPASEGPGLLSSSEAGGGGSSDDAGGGTQRPLNVEGRNSANGDAMMLFEDDDASSGTSPRQSSTSSSQENLAASPTGSGQQQPPRARESLTQGDEARAMENYYATLSSGYSSLGDNYTELTVSTNSSSTATADSNSSVGRRDSPVSSTPSDTHQRVIVGSNATADRQANQSQLLPAAAALATSGCERVPQLPTSSTASNNGHEQEDEEEDEAERCACLINDRRASFISQTFPSNLSTCLRNYICPNKAQKPSDEEQNLGDDDEDEICSLDNDADSSSGYEAQEAESSADKRQQLQATGRSGIRLRPVDVFQSYISLEHRTELVDTWRLAVERCMHWTKLHHEEVRKTDYQRLSSLPISMYLFFSIGMVALSGIVTATTGKSLLTTN